MAAMSLGASKYGCPGYWMGPWRNLRFEIIISGIFVRAMHQCCENQTMSCFSIDIDPIRAPFQNICCSSDVCTSCRMPCGSLGLLVRMPGGLLCEMLGRKWRLGLADIRKVQLNKRLYQS
mmetsp:Transcript_32443/g.67774  ORF Transcript_32443/g.67774 Transcript_32443/m.67774 type:complete len:120 (+) Transcript_32443:1854-2213(+)